MTVAGEAGLWCIKRLTLGPMSAALELMRISGVSRSGGVPATPGTGVRQPDLIHGPTTLRVFDMPLGQPQGAQPLLFVAAAGVEDGWRRAALTGSFNGGVSWHAYGPTAPPAVMGITLTSLAPGGAALFDEASSIDIELLNESMWLESVDDDSLAGGDNLALFGDELVQFGRAVWLSGGRFRLSRLLRGRRGTEWAAQGHGVGEPFTLIEREGLAVIEAPVGALGGSVRVKAGSVGDVEPTTADLPITAESLRPPSPVHLAATRLANGDIHIRWVRRSRLGWLWASGSDTPLGEENEIYRLALWGAGFERHLTTGSPSYLYTFAEQAADGLTGALSVSVMQIGTYAVSRPATLVAD